MPNLRKKFFKIFSSKKNELAVLTALAFLALVPALLLFKLDPLAEIIASWAYIFLIIGSFLNFTDKKKMVGVLKDLIKKMKLFFFLKQ